MLLSEEYIEQISSARIFKLCEFCGFHRLHLTSQKCTRLELIDHIHPPDDMGGECYFEIVAPYVQHLKTSGLDDVIDKITVKDHLTRVACANELIISSLHIEDCFFRNYWCEDMDVLEDNYENIFVGSSQNLKTLKGPDLDLIPGANIHTTVRLEKVQLVGAQSLTVAETSANGIASKVVTIPIKDYDQ
ncbi:hypothetical protein MTR67_007929 [Solanum verrucosum]|uniref:Uncharacterized protein n=1 Tax=Solanum verrucosum TaxID=315347 RepID=A0AAF0TDH9_SOLVR|nr:hypothetical protein MTR67_007929 [Solanum verrucosum]